MPDASAHQHGEHADPETLLCFLVGRPLVTPGTEFLVLHSPGLFLLVLGGAVVAPLAGRAF